MLQAHQAHQAQGIHHHLLLTLHHLSGGVAQEVGEVNGDVLKAQAQAINLHGWVGTWSCMDFLGLHILLNQVHQLIRAVVQMQGLLIFHATGTPGTVLKFRFRKLFEYSTLLQATGHEHPMEEGAHSCVIQELQQDTQGLLHVVAASCG